MDDDAWIKTPLDGLVFDRPGTWSVESQDDEDGTAIYLQSQGVAFAVVGAYPIEQDPQEIVEQVADSLRGEHPGLELETLDLDERSFSDGVAVSGLFMTLDTVAYCWVQSWRFAGKSILVFIQSVEKESGECEEAFFHICKSFHGPGTAR